MVQIMVIVPNPTQDQGINDIGFGRTVQDQFMNGIYTKPLLKSIYRYRYILLRNSLSLNTTQNKVYTLPLKIYTLIVLGWS